eukprot:331123-Prorocentrum_minimum.AAC.1
MVTFPEDIAPTINDALPWRGCPQVSTRLLRNSKQTARGRGATCGTLLCCVTLSARPSASFCALEAFAASAARASRSDRRLIT